MIQKFLPYGRHTLDEADIAAVVAVLRGGALTCGPAVDAFEAAFARKVGAAEAVVVSNGTTALHLALLASGFGPGDVAIVPTMTFLATSNAVHMAGGRVVFADVCPATGLMTPQTFEEAYQRAGGASGKVKAVLPVHLTGQAEHMDALSERAKHWGLTVIADCAHAIGARYKTGGCPGDGQFDDFGCFSLHPVKSIAMGEGGVVTAKTEELGAKLRLLRSHDMHRDSDDFLHKEAAFDVNGKPNPWYYEMQELGYNYRATDMQCALGLSQLSKLDQFLKRRQALADTYDKLLKPFSNLIVPNPRSADCISAWHLYAVKIDFAAAGKSRGDVMRALSSKGIGTQVHYIPVHEQPYYRKKYGQQTLPGAAAYYEGTLSLPLFPAMQDDDPARVVDALVTALS